MVGKLFIIILSSFLLFALSSCSLNNVMYPNQLEPGEFYAIQFKDGDIDAQESIILKPRKILTTDKVEVYLDDKGSNISKDTIDFIIDGFEKSYIGMTNTFGTHTDVDNNGKIIIIFFDINMGTGNSQYIAGYFSSFDLIQGYGNSAEILYVDSANVDDENKKAVLGTVVHEFQHLIDYNMNDVRLGRSSDLWINEARSEAANIIYAQNGNMPSNRLAIYNNVNNKKINNGNYFYKWDDITDTATSSLFMYWLYLQGEKKIIRDIAYSRQSYNYQSIVQAVNKKMADTGSWDDILLAWLLSNHVKGLPELSSYDALNLIPKVFTGGDVNLYPGDAIVSGKRPIFSSPNIRVENISGIYITLNKSTDINGASVSVGVPAPKGKNLEVNQNTTLLAKTPEDRIKHISQGDIKAKF